MRSIAADAAVRLYHLDAEGGIATTILYGTLAEALAAAAAQGDDVRRDLFVQTRDDVIAYPDLAGEDARGIS